MQTVIAGAGAQDVEVYATDARGAVVRPTSATYGIVDLEFSEADPDADRILVVAGTAATLDSLSTTTTAAAGPRESNPRLVAITAGVPVAGRQYVITGGGHSEAVMVDRVDGLNIYTRDMLRNRYALGATFVGCRLAASFPADRANDADELARRAVYAIDWVIVGATGPAYVRTMARIERRGQAPRATVQDLLRADPRLESASRERNTLDQHVAEADEEIAAMLLHRGDQVANRDDGMVGKFAVVWRALWLAYRILPPLEYADRAAEAKTEADRWAKRLLGGRKPDDAVEVARSTDARRGTRRAAAFGMVSE